MRGVTLIAVGNRGYLNWAINMACSIGYYSPDVKIQLLVSEELREEAVNSGWFDFITPLLVSDYTDSNGALFPAKLKLDLYRHLMFDETIYLDVDGMLIKDITPLFDIESDLAGDIQGVYDKSQGDNFEGLKWAKPAVIFNHYGFPDETKLPAINSSFLFIRKGAVAKSVFAQAYDNLMSNPIPIEKHWHIWGKKRPNKINQPDELYFDIACAQLGVIPENNVAVYFRLITDKGDYLKIEQLRDKHYAIGLFGDIRTNHLSVKEIYDKWMSKIWLEMTGTTFFNKSELLAKTKFAVV